MHSPHLQAEQSFLHVYSRQGMQIVEPFAYIEVINIISTQILCVVCFSVNADFCAEKLHIAQVKKNLRKEKVRCWLPM